MTISGELLAPGGNTPTTFQNMNADALRLGNGGTVLAYLKQTGGDAMTWVPSGPTFDGILKVMDGNNRVLKSISLVDSLVPAGRAVNDLTVERLANGGFVVAWADIDPADQNWVGLRARYAIYDDQGNLQTKGDLSSNPGYGVRVTALAGGGFATVFAAANGSPHSSQGVVNTFAYNAGAYTKGTETYVGDPNAPAPGANADTGKLWTFDEFSLTGLSDGGFVIGAPTYDYVASTYTPLGDFVFRYAANGAQTPFASGVYWQRVNWNDGQVNNAVLTKAFDGGFASVNRGKNGQWQVTMFHNDGSLITTTQKTQTVFEDSGRIVHTKTYYATDIAAVEPYAGNNYLDYDDFIDIAEINGELVVVLPNAAKGFSMAKLSKADGSLISITDLGITVPAGATLMSPRILGEGNGWDLSYDVMSIDGDGYYHQSTYQIGLSAPTNQAPLVGNIDGDATDFILGAPQYIDNGNFADISDPDSPNFDGGYLEVSQTGGSADGDFSFDLLVDNARILWGRGAQPDTSDDGTSFANPGPLAIGDKVWYSDVGSDDPADWILIGTVASSGQDGASLKIVFSNPALTVPSASPAADSFASALLKYLMYTAPTLGARAFEVRIADGDGAVSSAVSFGMTGISDQSSTITSAAGVSEPARLPTSATTPAGAVGVLDFTVADAGNGDGLATRVDSLVLQASGTGDFSKVTWLLSGPGIGAPLTGSYNASAHTLGFSGAGIAVADGASAVYTVKAYFNDTSGVAAGATYLLSLDGDSGVTLGNSMSSQMAPSQSPVTTGTGTVVVSGPGVLSVERATPAASPTNADSLSWTVRFSEAVSRIDAADFDVTGLSGETISIASAGGNAYTVTVSGGGLAGLNGSVTLGLAAGQDIVNGDGQALASLAPSGMDQRSTLVDNTAPAAPSVPDLQAASDSGRSDSDNLTRNTTPSFTGTAEAGALVTLVENGNVIGSATATGGTWTMTVSDLAPGSHTITAVATDAAGNASAPSGAVTVTIDTSVAAPTLALHADTGNAANDGRSNDGRIDVGLAGDVASWEYSTNGGGSWQAGSGSSFTLGAGTYATGQVRVRQTDIAGNASAAAANAAPFDIDTSVAAPTLALASDTGANASDGISRVGTVNVMLAADVAGWEYRTGGSAAWTSGSGFSFTLGPGSYAAGEIQVRQTDTAGNLSAAGSNAGAITIRDAAPAPSFALASDTGADAGDGITKIGTVNVGVDAGATWEYRTKGGAWIAGTGTSFTLGAGSWDIGDVEVRQTDLAGNLSATKSNGAAIVVDQSVVAPGFALANDTGASAADGLSSDGTIDVSLAADVAGWEYRTSSSGAWNAGSGTSFTLAPGSYAIGEVQMRQTDLAGNLSFVSANLSSLQIIAAPPAPSMALASDSGVSAIDGITRNGSVAVTLAAGAVSWEYRTSATGTWQAGSGTSFTLAPGQYAAGAVQVRQTDGAGSTSAAGSNAGAITVDTTAPLVGAIVRSTLASPAGSQSFVVTVRYADNGSGIDAATVDASDITITGPGALGTLAVSGASFDAATGVASYTVDAPAGGWSESHAGSWTIGVAAAGVRDLAGNAIANGGGSQAFSVSFNAAPAITSNGGGASATIDIAEGRTAVTTVLASDADAGDTLVYSISGGLDAARFEIDAASGVLRLRSAQSAASPVDSDANGSYLVDVTATDARGASDTQSLTVRVLRDTDGDGTPDTLDPDLDGDGRPNSAEDPVPSANGSGTGDGNGDGIADSTQVNVASLATVGSVALDKRFATLEVANGLTLSGVSNSAAPGSLPRNAKMPLGQFDFEVRGLAIGATVDIALYVDRSLGANGYYKQTSSGWVNLATASTVGNKTKLSFSITDGGIHDADGVANGVIVDPGGAVVIAPRIVSSGGLPAATIVIAENRQAVTTVQAEALGTVSYAITGGADAARFTIDAATGALSFVAAPDYESPQDLGDGAANNTYVVEVRAQDASGSDTQVLTVQVRDVDENPRPAPDDDGDNVPASTEQQVPSLPSADGTPGVAGDGNGDGRADSEQANVTSLAFLHTDQAQTNPGNAPPVYLTLVANSVDGKVPAGLPAPAVLKDVKQLDAPSAKPAGLALPLGQISFVAEVKSAGTTEHFSIYVDGAIPINGYFKQDKGGQWVNLADAAHGGKVVTEGGRTRLDFTIVDGGEFDEDGKADGVITDPGAPGYRAAVTGADSDNDQFPDALEATHGLTVGVKDNDVFGSSKLFVMELYRDLLFREAHAPEWNYWQGMLDSGAMDRAQLVSRFLDAAEFQAGPGALARLYFAAFDRLPDGAGLAYWSQQVGAGQALAAVAHDMVAGAEFTAAYGQLDDGAFVRQLYQNVLGRDGDAAGIGYWTSQLAGPLERAEVLLGFAQSAEFRSASDAEVTAALGYLGLLNRDPAQREVDYWVDKLDAGMPEAVVIGQFLSVPEYHDRFLP